MSVARYYAWLSRFQDLARGVAHDTGQRTFTVHRRLRADDGSLSGDVLHERLLAVLRATAAPEKPAAPARLEILDAGCGVGGTAFYLQAHLGGRCTGLTLSAEQQARAAAEAVRRGVVAHCRFVVRDYDADLTDLTAGGVDLVVAIESLAHAPDPAATLTRLAARLRPGGRLVLVDDVPLDTLARDDPDFVGFRDGWLCPAVASERTLAAAFEAANLTTCHDEDLTPRVRERSAAALNVLVGVNRALSLPLGVTPARVLMDALHGGLMLERLYQRRQVRYRLIVGRRGAGAHTTSSG